MVRNFLTALLILIAGAGADIVAKFDKIYDFSDPRAAADWMAVNDGVMGGVSEGEVRSTADGTVLFAGTLSFENNGGFASIRSRPRQWELGGRAGIALRVRGDGRAYNLNLRTDAAFDGINYRVSFTTVKGEWQTWRMPFDEFRATFRGRQVPNAPPLNPQGIASIGILISDKQEAPFKLEIAWIAGYSAD